MAAGRRTGLLRAHRPGAPCHTRAVDPNRVRLRLRIRLGDEHSLGRGKAQLLESIGEHGSISAAARSMGMAYRHAWEMVDDLNRCFRQRVVTTASGGRAGGGAHLTDFGRELVTRFRAMEARAGAALAEDLETLASEMTPGAGEGRSDAG